MAIKPRVGIQNPYLPTATLLHWMSKEKKPISPPDLLKKLGISYKIVPSSRFNDAHKRKHLKKTGDCYQITQAGLNFLKKNEDYVKTVEQVVHDWENRSVKKRGGDISIPMNAKANGAVDAIATLLEDYNSCIRLLKQINAQIDNLLKLNGQQ